MDRQKYQIGTGRLLLLMSLGLSSVPVIDCSYAFEFLAIYKLLTNFENFCFC